MARWAREPGRSTADRIFAVLDCFTPDRPEMRLSDIVRYADMPQSTAHRLCKALESWGGLERTADGVYRIGTKVWQAGTLAYLHSEVRQIAGPFMQELYEHTRENVHLAAIDGTRAVYVDIVRGHSSTRTGVRVGFPAPLHATGEGKILLANAPKSLVNQVIGKTLAKFTPYTIVTPGHLVSELTKIRNRGLAFCNQELTLGTYSVAVSIRDAADAVYALSVVVNSSSPLRERLPALLTRTAAQLSTRLRDAMRQPYGTTLMPIPVPAAVPAHADRDEQAHRAMDERVRS